MSDFIYCTDPSSVKEFEKFKTWAIGINQKKNSLNYPNFYPGIVQFYDNLMMQSKNLGSLIQSPETNSPTSTSGWLKLNAYDVSSGLLDGFFEGEKNWHAEVKGNTYQLTNTWSNTYLTRMTTNNQYDAQKADKFIEEEAITVIRLPNGKYIHPYNGNGRHRLMALKALGAPIAPVTLLQSS